MTLCFCLGVALVFVVGVALETHVSGVAESDRKHPNLELEYAAVLSSTDPEIHMSTPQIVRRWG